MPVNYTADTNLQVLFSLEEAYLMVIHCSDQTSEHLNW